MTLSPGDTLGPYEVLAKIGEGGMGEVYRARDTRLDRIVAIKVLSAQVATDPELRERFEREAKTVAALSHPNICPIYDVGAHEGTEYLVMEHLEGETLAQRLERGAVPLGQALEIAAQVADALEMAHRQGIVHRDLKPANVMLTRTGAAHKGSPQAKLLDFGLAKLKGREAGAGELPTLETRTAPLTEKGTILGTFQYMAPEQLEGQEADARSDIFAFGAVVYELVTGKKAFEGKSRASLIAAILEREPPSISSVESVSPPALDRIVSTCLAKDPDARWQSIGDVGRQLRWVAQGDEPALETAASAGSARAGGPWLHGAIGALIAAVLVGGAVWLSSGPDLPPTSRLALNLPDGFEPIQRGLPVSLSPDGQTVLVVGCEQGCSEDAAAGSPFGPERGQVFLRRLGELDLLAVPGTEGASEAMFSPDGETIVFSSQEGVRAVPVSGGSVVTLYDGPDFGVAVDQDGTVVVAGLPGEGLMTVAGPGAAAQPLTEAAADEFHMRPQVLPEGGGVLFTRRRGAAGVSEIVVASRPDGAVRVVAEGANARFLPSGHLVFARGRTLFAVGFDPRTLDLTGAPVPVVDDLRLAASGLLSAGLFDLSASGTLIYPRASADQDGAIRSLVWVDRAGEVTPTAAPERPYGGFDLSPDDRRIAVGVSDGNAADIWLYDIERGTSERVTRDAVGVGGVTWHPDGDRLVYRSATDGGGIFLQRADGIGPVDRLVASGLHVPSMFTPDGTTLLVTTFSAETREDIGSVPVEADSAYVPLLNEGFTEWEPTMSPDGQWLAYSSNESGRAEVYVRPFPEVGSGRTLVSTAGGRRPTWSADGSELFYVAPDGMTVVSLETDPTFAPGLPRLLFDTAPFMADGARTPFYDVTSTGQRFLMLERMAGAGGGEIVVVQNWRSELDRLVPLP